MLKEPKKFNVPVSIQVKNAKKVAYQSVPAEKNVELFDATRQRMIDQLIEKRIGILRAEFAKTLAEERKKSYQEGYNQGQEEARKKFQDQLNATLKSFMDISREIKEELNVLLAREEQNILKLVLVIARKVVDAEIKANRDLVLHVVKNALNILSGRTAIKIYLNPVDLTIVQTNISQLDLKLELPKDIEIIGLPTITQGGCKIEYESGVIDADLDTQFQEIERQLLSR